MRGLLLLRRTALTCYTPHDHWVGASAMRQRDFITLLSSAAAWPRECTFGGLTPLVLATVMGLTLGGCSQPSDTPPSAQQPTAADRARKDADDKAWAEAEKTETVAAFTSYLQNFPSGAHTAEASRHIVALMEQAKKDADDKAWADAEKIGSAAAFNVYIQNFGSGAHVAEGRRRIAALDEQARKEADEMAWTEAVRIGTAAAFNAYVQNFGSGAHVAEARQRIAALDEQARKEAEEKAWTEAVRTGTAAAFNGYLENFGSGAHAAEARQRVAALETRGREEVERRVHPRKALRAKRANKKSRHQSASRLCDYPGNGCLENVLIPSSRVRRESLFERSFVPYVRVPWRPY